MDEARLRDIRNVIRVRYVYCPICGYCESAPSLGWWSCPECKDNTLHRIKDIATGGNENDKTNQKTI